MQRKGYGMRRHGATGGLVLLLVVFGLVGGAFAQEEEMTREAYIATMDDYTQREEAAKASITTLDADIARLQAEIDAVQGQIDQRASEVLSLVGATDAEVAAFGRRVDGLLRQLQGLAALAPEELQRRRGELKVAAAEIAELRTMKIAALPEMKAKLDRASKLLADLMMRAPDEITYEVMRGDHLWGIASKPEIYDDPYMWPRIYRANRDQISDPDLIYPEQMLNVPIAVGENQYLVTSGDFLTKIAEAVYNDPTMWHKIYRANEQQIIEPSLVFPAQVLDIPAN